MRYIPLLLLLIHCFTSLPTFAQTDTGKITGTVITENQKALEAATITLLQEKDSAVVKMSVSDQAGIFEFNNIPFGKYIVMVSAVGYQTIHLPAHLFTNQFNISLKNIKLLPLPETMAGVTVTAKRPPIEVRAGRTLVNVDASPTNAGLNVLEILEKSPGVAVDNDGNVSLKGKNGVLILIDGRQTYLSGSQLAAFLRRNAAS